MCATKNATLFCTSFRFSRIEFQKPPFNLMYHISKVYGVFSNIVFDEVRNGLYFNESLPLTEKEYKGVNLINLSCGKKATKAKIYAEYKKYVKSNARKTDLFVTFHGDRTGAKLCNYYKKLNPAGKVMTVLDFSPTDGQAMSLKKRVSALIFHNRFAKFVRNCDIFTVETGASYNYLKENGWKCFDIGDKLQFMRFGYNAEGFDISAKNSEKENLFITVGRIGTSQKNNMMMLEALDGIILKNGWKFMFVGPVEEAFKVAAERFLHKNPQLKDSIVFTGSVEDRKKLSEIYGKAKVFVLSSVKESFALVLVEAALFNNYILSTPVGCAKDVIFEGRNGRIYNTAGELRNIIKEIMEEKDFVSDKKTNAEVAALYDWDNIVSDFGFLKELFS